MAPVLFAVTMTVDLPAGMDPDEKNDLLAREKAYSQELQRAGVWPHIWRVAGKYSNLSIFDVADNDALHEALWNLPLFPYMEVQVTPLAHHPSSVH